MRILSQLERGHTYLNGHFFGGVLPKPAITVERTGGDSVAGWFRAGGWTVGPQVLDQIAVSRSEVADGLQAALAVLLHEMVHQWNGQKDILDVSRHQYHNRHFRDSAWLAGLECHSYNSYSGYGHTLLSDRGRRAVNAFIAARPSPSIACFRSNSGASAEVPDGLRVPVPAENSVLADGVDLVALHG